MARMATLATWATLAAAAFLAAPAASAGVDVDFGASVPIGDDGRLFVNISSRAFDYEPPVVERLAVRVTDPDDLAVGLFIARRSLRSPDEIFALRARGLSWWLVAERVRLPFGVWFVQVGRPVGPRFDRAYGHWRKFGPRPQPGFALSDAEARDLVAVRVVHEYYGIPVERAMELRAGGRDMRRMAVETYRDRHGRRAEPARRDGRVTYHDDRGHDRAPGYDKDRGRDKDRGYDKAPGRDKDRGYDKKTPDRDKAPGHDKTPDRDKDRDRDDRR